MRVLFPPFLSLRLFIFTACGRSTSTTGTADAVEVDRPPTGTALFDEQADDADELILSPPCTELEGVVRPAQSPALYLAFAGGGDAFGCFHTSTLFPPNNDWKNPLRRSGTAGGGEAGTDSRGGPSRS